MVRKTIGLGAILLALLAPASQAQMIDGAHMYTAIPDYGQSLVYGSTFSRSYMERVSGKKLPGATGQSRSPRLAPPGVNAPVSYDASISAEVGRDYLKAIAASTNDKAAAGLGQYYARNPVRSVFERTVRPYGLGSADLADVTAGYLVAMWMTANDTGLPNAAQVKVVRDQVRAGAGAGTSPAQRQRIAEILMYQTVTLLNVRETAQRGRDAAALKSLADSSQQALLQQGIDLRKLALTKKGFVPRGG